MNSFKFDFFIFQITCIYYPLTKRLYLNIENIFMFLSRDNTVNCSIRKTNKFRKIKFIRFRQIIGHVQAASS